MKNQLLAEEIRRIEQNGSDSLRLVKCYELLGGREADARRVAQRVSHKRLETLNWMVSEGYHFYALSEHYLGAIYALQMAGNASQAKDIFEAFLRRARQDMPSGTPFLPTRRAFSVVVALVIMEDHKTSVEDLLPAHSFSATLVEAWKNQDVDAIEKCCFELEKNIEKAENEDDLVPWADVWDYILAFRLGKFLRDNILAET